MVSSIVIPIIFQTKKGPETDFEFRFNEYVLFKNIKHQNYFDDGLMQIRKDSSIIVYSSNRLKPKKAFLDYLETMKNVILFHCSNESLNHFTGYYKCADAVLRSGGWNPNISNSRVFSVPLAFQSEFFNSKPSLINLKNREYAWCFFGSLKGDRYEMYQALKAIKPYYNFQSKGWMDPDNKSPEQVIEYYKNMVFIPSPAGNIYFECNRTMDALEWGCIPVTTKFLGEDCYKYIYGDHPFIVGENWEDTAFKMKNLLDDENKLYEYQKKVRDWYFEFKEQLASDVIHIINGEFDQLEGIQFQYQKEARNNVSLKWRFFKHFTLDVYWKRLIGKALPSKNN